MRSALKNVEAHLSEALLPDLPETRVRQYVAARSKQGVSGRCVNVELGELSRDIGQVWKMLWPRLRSMEERHEVGRANAGRKAALVEGRRRLGFRNPEGPTGLRSADHYHRQGEDTRRNRAYHPDER